MERNRGDLKSAFDIIEENIDITKGFLNLEFLDGKIIKAKIDKEIYKRRKQ